MSDEFYFDKFMEDILIKEEAARKKQESLPDEPEESPQRKYRRLYSELWQNRIVWRERRH